MSKVWVVSGIVLIGTGLALAGFGAWLAGNPNCDAADLGRSCMVASLGVAVIGAALSGAGWLRVRRLEVDGADEARTPRLLAERPGLVLLIFLVVGLVLLAALFPGPALPVEVYGKPAPEVDRLPEEFVPSALAGLNRTSLATEPSGGTAEAAAAYEGGAGVKVTRFNASNATNATGQASRAAARQAADDYLDRQYGGLDPGQGARVCVRDGDRHWFSQTGPATNVLSWRSGTFVFEVSAPTQDLRDRLARDLAD